MTPIGPARIDHAEHIAAVEAAATPHPWTLQAVHDTLSTASTCAWVVNNGAVGHILVSVAGPSADILTVAVHPEHQRRGHARALLDHVHGELRHRGVVDVFLEVRDTNAPAIALYERSGYETVGTRRRYYRDGCDARVMKRAL